MGAHILTPRTVPVDPGPSGLAPDLVHDTVVDTGGGVFAVGWVDDIPAPPAQGAERQMEET